MDVKIQENKPKWQQASLVEKARFLPDIRALEPVYSFNPDTTFVDYMKLPFYQDTLLLRVLKAPYQGNPFWYLRIGDETIALDGTEDSLASLPPQKQDPLYTLFYTAFSRGTLPARFEF